MACTETEAPLVGETEMLAGHIIHGGESSMTARGKEQVFTLPALSTAVHETLVVVWIKNLFPELGQVRFFIPEPSVAVTLEAKLTMGSARLSLLCVV